jgi:hypothetical protein
VKKAVLTVVLLLTFVSVGYAVELCDAGYVNGNGCVAQMCRQCADGFCNESYEKIIYCPGQMDGPIVGFIKKFFKGV